jgi:hypothetical protein
LEVLRALLLRRLIRGLPLALLPIVPSIPPSNARLPVAALVVLVAVLAPDGAELDLCGKAGR